MLAYARAGEARFLKGRTVFNIFRHLPSLFSHDMAIDLGTANTLG